MSEWVSVDDRLPDGGTNGVHDCYNVLVFAECPYYPGTIKVATWMDGRFSNYPAGATKITHWMPLPEPPND